MRTDDSAPARPIPARRSVGGIFVLVVVAIVAAGVASLALAWVPSGLRGFPVVARDGYQEAPGPITAVLHGIVPGPAGHGRAPSNDVRAIRLRGPRIDLVVGGRTVRSARHPSATFSLRGLVATIADPTWIREVRPGQVRLMAGLVVDGGARLRVGAPAVEKVILDDRSGAMIGARRGGRLSFTAVTVTSNASGRRDSRDPRPMVIAAQRAELTADRTTFANLGWDWNGSYGVTWSSEATGGATRSVFAGNFIGAYTSQVRGLRFVGCTFEDNAMYGLDPHTFSSHLSIENVIARGNGSHGIILSKTVTDSVVRGSTSRDNGENGIVAETGSSGNLIAGNLVEGNTGDGIVTAASAGNTIRNNLVRRNRVGLRIDPADATTTRIEGNRLYANRMSHQGVRLPADNPTRNNGGQWRTRALRGVWLATATGLVAGIGTLIIANRLLRRRAARNRT